MQSRSQTVVLGATQGENRVTGRKNLRISCNEKLVKRKFKHVLLFLALL